MAELGAVLPAIGPFVTDVFAFTGAGAIINDVISILTPNDEPIKNVKEDITTPSVGSTSLNNDTAGDLLKKLNKI
jgi:hypothetical protein